MEKRAEWWVYISARNKSDTPSELTDQLTEHGIAWCDGHVTDDRIEEFRINTADPEWIIEL